MSSTIPSRLGAGLSPNFWRLWGSTLAANLADGISAIAFPLLAVRLTDSPVLVAGVAVAHQAPLLVFVLAAGALADRLDRRVIMLVVQVLRVVVIGAMAGFAVADALTLPVLYAAAFLLGLGETFFDTTAQSILPLLVRREQLAAANGRLFAAETTMNSFVGPPVGGFLVGASAPLALATGAVGFLVAALGLGTLRGSFRAERAGPRRRLHSDIAEGLTYLVRHRLLFTLSTMVATGRLASSAMFAVFVLFAVAPGPMGLSEPQFGLLTTAFAAGSLLGSLIVARVVARFGQPWVLSLAQALFGVALFVPFFTADPVVVGLGLAVGGAAVMLWNVTNVSLRQSILPPQLYGRVHATHRFYAAIAGVGGALLGGLIAEAAGVRAVFAFAFVVIALSLLGRLVVTEDAIRAALGATSHTER